MPGHGGDLLGSLAIGLGSLAIGLGSLAIGLGSLAIGLGSLAIGLCLDLAGGNSPPDWGLACPRVTVLPVSGQVCLARPRPRDLPGDRISEKPERTAGSLWPREAYSIASRRPRFRREAPLGTRHLAFCFRATILAAHAAYPKRGSMTRRIILIKHEDSPGDDRAATWFAEQGFVLDWRFPYVGGRLPALDAAIAGAVLYGGPQSAAEADRLPYLADEARWIRRCIARQVPVLGLCLGGQIIAHALGASVGPDPDGQHEFGYYALAPTDRGRAFFPDRLVVPQAHYHGFALPDGAELLARSARYPHQAIRYGERTFAFQFHPEVTLPIFRRWQQADWAPWGAPGAQARAEQDALAARHDQTLHHWFTEFLARLFGAADRVPEPVGTVTDATG